MNNTGYAYIDDIAIADVAFRAWARTLDELCIQAARATMEVMIPELDSIRAVERREVHIDESSAEMLVFELLQELVFYKDAESLMLLPESLAVRETDSDWHLDSVLAGEPLDLDRHPMNADVKAVTLHRFRVECADAQWQAEAVLDI